MAFKITAQLKGSQKLMREIRRRGEQQPRKLAGALFVEGERIMAASKKIVPVDQGPLRASGHVQLPIIRRGRVSVTLGYGGPSAPYAVYVHERQARHKPPTQWKYLSKPLNEAIPGMAGRIARTMGR